MFQMGEMYLLRSPVSDKTVFEEDEKEKDEDACKTPLGLSAIRGTPCETHL